MIVSGSIYLFIFKLLSFLLLNGKDTKAEGKELRLSKQVYGNIPS